jgi:hypothetical protein
MGAPQHHRLYHQDFVFITNQQNSSARANCIRYSDHRGGDLLRGVFGGWKKK